MVVHNLFLASKESGIFLNKKVVGSVEATTKEDQDTFDTLTSGFLKAFDCMGEQGLNLGESESLDTKKYKLVMHSGNTVKGYLFVDPTDSCDDAKEAVSVFVDVFDAEFKDVPLSSGLVGEQAFPFNHRMEERVWDAATKTLYNQAFSLHQQLAFMEPYHRLQQILIDKVSDPKTILDGRAKFSLSGLIFDLGMHELAIPNPVKEYWDVPVAKIELPPEFPNLSFNGPFTEAPSDPVDPRLLNPFVLYSYGVKGEGEARPKGVRPKYKTDGVPLQNVFKAVSGVFKKFEEEVPAPQDLLIPVHDIMLDAFSRLYVHYSDSVIDVHAARTAEDNLSRTAKQFDLPHLKEIIDTGIQRKKLDDLLRLKVNGGYTSLLSNPEIYSLMTETVADQKGNISYAADENVISSAYTTFSLIEGALEDPILKRVMDADKGFSDIRKEYQDLSKKILKAGIPDLLTKGKLKEAEIKTVYTYMGEVMKLFDKTAQCVASKKNELSTYRVGLSPWIMRTHDGMSTILHAFENFADNYSAIFRK